MNQQALKNESCLRDQDETLTIDRLANMNVSSIDTRESAETNVNYPSPFSKQSFEHIVVSRRSLSMDLEDRDIDSPVVAVSELQKKLSISLSRSISISRDYPFREVSDSREQNEQNHCDFRQDRNEERSSATNRATQDIFISPTSKAGSFESSSNNDNSFWGGSMSSLKRANPIYESDNEFEERGDYEYQHSMRKRRCSIERLTTAVYWHNELKTADE